jgi:hypothetical protein
MFLSNKPGGIQTADRLVAEADAMTLSRAIKTAARTIGFFCSEMRGHQ